MMRPRTSIPERARDASELRGRVLIVEPDELLRWSMESYLRRWFEVRGVRDTGEAEHVLEAGALHALIVSDGFTRRQTESLQEHARTKNPQVRIICTVSDVPDGRHRHGDTVIEKPFQLSRLAELLGVADGASKSSA